MGLAGPMSNYAAPPQLVEDVPYRLGPRRNADGDDYFAGLDEYYAFARHFREKNHGQWFETERLGGFCLLLKRQVLDNLPLLEAGLALFDTDQLSARAREGGWALACCADLFIHHFGTRTFVQGAPG